MEIKPSNAGIQVNFSEEEQKEQRKKQILTNPETYIDMLQNAVAEIQTWAKGRGFQPTIPVHPVKTK